MEVHDVQHVATNLAKHGKFQEPQFSQAYPDILRRFVLLFRVALSLNPRLAFGLKIHHLLRHKTSPVYLPTPECWSI
jgi:hypothetical protein